MDSALGSRQRALKECQDSGPGTVGAVVARILNLPGISLTVRFEIASGDIGVLYQRPEMRAILRSPWTDTNLRELAKRETAFFQSQSGAAGVVGRVLSEDGRFSTLKAARNNLF